MIIDPNIKSEFRRLMNSDKEEDQLQSYDLVLDTAFKLFNDHQKKTFKDQMDQEANLLYQMTIVKGLAIKKYLEGVSYRNSINTEIKYDNFLDSFSIWPIVRAQLEAYCNFNNIYIQSNTEEEKALLYDLWVLSGLQYRQRFKSAIKIPDYSARLQLEKNEIKNIQSKIEKNSLFLSLEEKEKKKIRKAIDEKKFQLYIHDGKVLQAHWHQMLKNAGTRDNFEHMYSMLSLSTHPSNISVFQFRDIYQDQSYKVMTLFAMETSKNLLAFFIRDYCEYFSELKFIFNALPGIHQLLINALNSAHRGEKYELNDLYRYI